MNARGKDVWCSPMHTRVKPLTSTGSGKPTGGAGELEVAHGEDLDEGEGRDGEGDGGAKVLGLLELNLASVSPGDAGVGLGDHSASQAKHGPAGVKELALAEAEDVEGLVEGLRNKVNRRTRRFC